MSTPGNSLGITAAGLVKFDGTSTFSGVTTTNHDVLIGSTSNGITNVGPGSAGQVLQSGGGSADPSYSTPTYPSASGTSRKILVSDGTNNVYSTETWATPGSSGNLLTSDGTNWTSSAAQTQPIGNSNSIYQYVEDFILAENIWQSNNSGTGSGVLFNTTLMTAGSLSAAHPGVMELKTGTTSTGSAFITYTIPGSSIKTVPLIGGGITTITFYFNIQTLSTPSQRYSLLVGLSDNNTTTTPTTNGIWLSYSDNVNSGNWVMNTKASASTTSSNSSTAVSSGWQVVQIVINAAGSSVSFSAGTTLAALASLGSAIVTNIPTSTTSAAIPTFGALKSVGTTSVVFSVDLFTLQTNLTAR